VSLAISRGPISRSHVQGRSPRRLWVELPSGVEERGLFGPRRREGPGRATACCESRVGVRVVSEPRLWKFSLFRKQREAGIQ
jgi:hypothetical protein